MTQPNVFLSYSSKDAAFASRLETDLRSAGATVYRVSANQGGDFQKRINEALAACQWVVLVLTKDALASPWVEQEIDAANRLKHQGRVKDILPIQAELVNQRDIPALWGVYNIFDATQDYQGACEAILQALGLLATVSTADEPTPGYEPWETAEALTQQAYYYVNERNSAEALVWFDRALARDPDYAKAWHGKGATLDGLKRYDEALACYDRALDLFEREPNLWERYVFTAGVWFNKGGVLGRMGRTAEAMEASQKGAEENRKANIVRPKS